MANYDGYYISAYISAEMALKLITEQKVQNKTQGYVLRTILAKHFDDTETAKINKLEIVKDFLTQIYGEGKEIAVDCVWLTANGLIFGSNEFSKKTILYRYLVTADKVYKLLYDTRYYDETASTKQPIIDYTMPSKVIDLSDFLLKGD